MLTHRPALDFDPAIERVRARVRMIVAISLVALLAGTAFGSGFSYLMRPLMTAVASIPTAAH